MPEPRRNVELKVPLPSLEEAREVAKRLEIEPGWVEHQRDTYFRCPVGRLKLREIRGQEAVLIAYRRPDEQGSRTSRYHLVPAPHPHALITALDDTLGRLAVVEKTRHIHLWHNVRIHLDEVSDLGTFLEFEAVLDPGQEEADGRAQIETLRAEFGLDAGAGVPGSYLDLIRAATPSRNPSPRACERR